MKNKIKKKLRFRIAKVASIAAVVALVFSLASANFLERSTVRAVGDLNVIWGVPDGDPIFVVANMLPGDVESRSVDVENNGTESRLVSIRGVKTSETLNFSTVLDFVILEGLTPIYGDGSPTGPKTLDEFFTDSGDINGLPLSSLAPSASTTYTFKVTFDPAAGNEFQNAQVIFDLIIGISFDVPEECQNIEFSGDPIFGTALGDVIDGTEGNDLINGLEGGDAIDGKGGDDCIIGNLGGDYLEGGEGNDVIFGNEGGDTLVGEGGNDLLIGGVDSDTLMGGAGEDILLGNDGHDTLDGGQDKDHLEGHGGLDTLMGGSQDDFLDGGPGGTGNTVDGQDDTDTCLNGFFLNCEIFP